MKHNQKRCVLGVLNNYYLCYDASVSMMKRRYFYLLIICYDAFDLTYLDGSNFNRIYNAFTDPIYPRQVEVVE